MASSLNLTAVCLENLQFQDVCLQHGSCNYVSSNTSTCACDYLWKGGNCTIPNPALPGVFAFDGVFYFLVLVFFVFFLIRQRRKLNGEDFKDQRLKGVMPSHPKYFGLRFILLYRFVAFGYTCAVQIFSVVQGGALEYRFYTVWNFITIVVYFAIGLALTILTLRKGHEAIENSAYWQFNADLHYILLEIELPNTLM